MHKTHHDQSEPNSREDSPASTAPPATTSVTVTRVTNSFNQVFGKDNSFSQYKQHTRNSNKTVHASTEAEVSSAMESAASLVRGVASLPEATASAYSLYRLTKSLHGGFRKRLLSYITEKAHARWHQALNAVSDLYLGRDWD